MVSFLCTSETSVPREEVDARQMTLVSFQPRMAIMSEAPTLTGTADLADRDAAILDFEDSWFTSSVPKEQAIMENFSLTAARYYQRLNTLIDLPEALAYKPLLVKRLRRMRVQRQAARSARRLQG